MSNPPEDFANLLHRRCEYLRALIDHPQDKRNLVEMLDTPRSTLDDVVRELEQAGLVEYIDGQWHPTHSGRLACCVHQDYLNNLANLIDTSSVLDALHANSEVSWEFIEGADVYKTHPGVLDSVIPTLLDHVEMATDIRIVSPSIVAGYGKQFDKNKIFGPESTFEMIISPKIQKWIYSMHQTAIIEALDKPDVCLLCAPISFSFGLSIFDSQRAGITIFTPQGIAGLIINDTESALAWAEELYESVKQDASPIIQYEEPHQTPNDD
ncbi:hypothetical protein EIK79_06255 [Halocatena pleomorpha]|uniref:MarR family transcriptional regulator n=1 Tax=Halocatena pleomorpha TaxID=1785090 RepID=A0A3P3RED8_9EURY|nr:hypothetical protein EIK79_06255 [Halocatena pleomorpha]